MQSAQMLETYVEEEICTRRQQGCDTWELERQLNLAQKAERTDRAERLKTISDRLKRLEPDETFDYVEPNELDDICSSRPPGPRSIGAGVGDNELRDKTLGGWVGRVAGCMSGKPVEGWNWQRIRDVLKSRNSYPLDDYFPPPQDREQDDKFEDGRHVYKGHVQKGIKDDDINYTVLGLRLLERCGRNFTSQDVARQWLMDLPFDATYTAERAAYRNFVNNVFPPESATMYNPYREWIGGQIRADIWGYINPGHPEKAARMAYRDARISHARNGIYGAMWVAAMIAGCFVTSDRVQIIRIGLSEIPAKCRLAEVVNDVVEWYSGDENPEQTVRRLVRRYPDHGDVHVLNNAGIVANSLLWGKGDFTKSVGLAVMSGLDTDCNGATVGSILGVLNGCESIPGRWKNPLNNILETDIARDSRASITEMADRTRMFQDR